MRDSRKSHSWTSFPLRNLFKFQSGKLLRVFLVSGFFEGIKHVEIVFFQPTTIPKSKRYAAKDRRVRAAKVRPHVSMRMRRRKRRTRFRFLRNFLSTPQRQQLRKRRRTKSPHRWKRVKTCPPIFNRRLRSSTSRTERRRLPRVRQRCRGRRRRGRQVI